MFTQKLIDQIRIKKTPLCVGLDPRLAWIPKKITAPYQKKYGSSFKAATFSIIEFNQQILNVIAPLVPAVKLQIAFYEQYGSSGMEAFSHAITYAKKKGLVVIADAKRGDIDSTADAYASAFLGETDLFGVRKPCYDVDAITINPFLGEASMIPFIETARTYGKGVFILVKTSNPGSGDIQDAVAGKNTVSEKIASMINKYAEKEHKDKYGYTNIGAVIGLQFPKIVKKMRKIMPSSFFLVPGYGAQGGDIKNAKYFFNRDGFGAIVSSSRSIIFAYRGKTDGDNKYLTYIANAVFEAKITISEVLYKA